MPNKAKRIRIVCETWRFISRDFTNNLKPFWTILNVLLSFGNPIKFSLIKNINNIFCVNQVRFTLSWNYKSTSTFRSNLQEKDKTFESSQKSMRVYFLILSGQFKDHSDTLKNLARLWKSKKNYFLYCFQAKYCPSVFTFERRRKSQNLYRF